MADLDRDQYQSILDHVSDGVYTLDGRRHILQWNRGAEELTGYSAAEVVGRSCSDNVLVHIDGAGKCLCKSGCPVSATLADGQERQADVFLHHKDGHRVPVRVSVIPLRDASGKVVAAVETFHANSEIIGLRRSVEKLKQWSQIDLETGIAGRRAAEAALNARVEEMRRFGWSFAILLAEIDFYNSFKENLSAEMLSRLVRMVGRSLKSSLRPFDVAGRWENNEFLLVLANVGLDELPAIAERCRMLVEASFLHTPVGPLGATVSLGGTAVEERDNSETLLRRAQVCLLESRNCGRNRATLHGQVKS